MAKEVIGHLKSQEEVNNLMACLWFRRKKWFKRKSKDVYFVYSLPDITEDEKESRWDYDRRLSMALSIVEQGHPVSWANGITRISETTIQRECEKMLAERKKLQKLTRINNIRLFFKNPYKFLKSGRLKK